ncbi:RNA polymerase subunit sigma [bacterium]|jgi:hypothetical protein|nr:RNA polymerase subunit sigma [bacterium]
MANKSVDTRKNEIRITTSDTREMFGKFLADRLYRGWMEDFVDEDTGAVVTIERKEVILDRGTILDEEKIAQISFHMQANDIKEVTVSNQRRLAMLQANNVLYPWLAIVKLGTKKKKFLLHATTIDMATEIVKDYVELNYTEGFYIYQLKEFDNCIILKDNLKKYQVDLTLDLDNIELAGDETGDMAEAKFYQIETTVTNDEYSYTQSFVVETKDVEKAMIVIKDYVIRKIHDNDGQVIDLEVKLEAAKILPCDSIIEKEFSLAYAEVKDPVKKAYDNAMSILDEMGKNGISIKAE